MKAIIGTDSYYDKNYWEQSCKYQIKQNDDLKSKIYQLLFCLAIMWLTMWYLLVSSMSAYKEGVEQGQKNILRQMKSIEK